MRFVALSALTVAAASTAYATATDAPLAPAVHRNAVVATDVPNAKRLGILPGEYTINEFLDTCFVPCLHKGESATTCSNKCDSVVEYDFPNVEFELYNMGQHLEGRATQGPFCEFFCQIGGKGVKECREECAGAP